MKARYYRKMDPFWKILIALVILFIIALLLVTQKVVH
jgi:hypothetical protein